MLWYVDASCCMQLNMGFAPASIQQNTSNNGFYDLVFQSSRNLQQTVSSSYFIATFVAYFSYVMNN